MSIRLPIPDFVLLKSDTMGTERETKPVSSTDAVQAAGVCYKFGKSFCDISQTQRSLCHCDVKVVDIKFFIELRTANSVF